MRYSFFDSMLDNFYEMEVTRSQIKTLWSLGHYDGVMTGLVEYRGKIHLAYSPFDSNVYPRIFLIIEVTEEKINECLDYLEKRYLITGNMKYNSDGTKDTSIEINHFTSQFKNEITQFYKDVPMPSYYPEQEDMIVGWFRNWKQ